LIRIHRSSLCRSSCLPHISAHTTE
jgi:hypothetical protein